MRIAFALVLLMPAVASAQSGSYLAVVGDVEVRLRAGPSDSFPEAGTLPPGTRVLVDHEESGGWLAIQAPPGSVSWVPNAQIEFDASKPLPQNAVTHGEVTLAAGRVGLAQPIADVQVRRAKVPEGTILTVIGEKAQFEGKWWYPVTPPEGDFRYIPKAAVQLERAANKTFAVRANDTTIPAAGVAAGGGAAPAGGIVASVPTKPVTNNPLWAQAEAAEREGRFDDAEKLYFEVARVASEADRELANRCYSRIHGLREKNRGTPAAANPPTRNERASVPPPARDAAALPPTSAKETTRPPAGASSTPGEKPDWQKPGVLTRAAIAPGGKKTYALESSPGVVTMYVQAGDGIDPERYVNRRVAVYGTPANVPRLSKPLVVAMAIDPAGN